MTPIVFITAIVSAILVQNVVLMRYLGMCSFVGVSTKMKSSVGMGVAVTIIMALATAITYPLFNYVLVPLEIGYIDTIVFILVIAVLVQLTEMVLKKYVKGLYNAFGLYLPLITTNCAILGLAQIGALVPTFGEAMALSIGSGLGYALVMILFTAIRVKLESANIPKALKGAPIAFLVAGLMALAFLGFQGLV